MAGYSVRTHENLIALVWFDAPSMEGVQQLRAAFARTARATNRKIGFATRASAAAAKAGASPAIRQAIADLLREYSHRLGATVIIYEGTGLHATIVRVIISAINLLSRATFPSEVHASVLAGSIWLLERLGPDAPTAGEKRLLELLPARPDRTTAPVVVPVTR